MYTYKKWTSDETLYRGITNVGETLNIDQTTLDKVTFKFYIKNKLVITLCNNGRTQNLCWVYIHKKYMSTLLPYSPSTFLHVSDIKK